MLRRFKKEYLGISISILGIIVLYIHGQLAYYIEQFTDIFAGGRSLTKAFAFFVYLLLLYFLKFIPDRKINLHFSKEKIKKIFIGITIVLGLYGFFLLIVFLKKYNLPLKDCVTFFNNNEISSTCIFHNHIAKGSIAFVLSIFGIHSLEFTDAGHAFLGSIHTYHFILYAILLLFSVIFSIVVFLQEKKEIKNHILYTPLYAVVTFGLIEHTFDGGILDPRTIALFGLLLILMYGYNRIKDFIFLYIFAFLLFGFEVKNGSIVIREIQERIGFGLIAYIGLIFIPLLVLYKKIPKKKYNLAFFYIIVCIAPFFIGVSETNIYRKISTQNKAWYMATYKKNDQLKLIDTVGSLFIYREKNSNFKNIGSVVDHYDLLDNIYPVMVENKTCTPKQEIRNTYLYTVKSSQIPSSLLYESHNGYVKTQLEQINRYDTLHTYRAETILGACIPRTLNTIGESIQELGLSKFFIIEHQHDF